MNSRALYDNFVQQLKTIYPASEAAAIAKLVWEKAGVSNNQPLNDVTIQQFDNQLSQLLQHKPVQYVLEEAWFYNLRFNVNEHVLIPRPETEELAELVINEFKGQKTLIKILDIGTGSGCISIVLKKNLPQSDVTSIDISREALAVAQKNAAANNVSINFSELDFLNEEKWQTLHEYDVIISNPPYIPANEKEVLDKNVTAFEPHTALFVPDEKPLLFYEAIARFAEMHLAKGGKIFMEIHEKHAAAVAAIFESTFSAEIKKDISGKERMVVVSY